MSRTIAEFRIPEELASIYRDADTGKTLGGTVRQVMVDTTDPLCEKIGAIHQAFRARGRPAAAGRGNGPRAPSGRACWAVEASDPMVPDVADFATGTHCTSHQFRHQAVRARSRGTVPLPGVHDSRLGADLGGMGGSKQLDR